MMTGGDDIDVDETASEPVCIIGERDDDGQSLPAVENDRTQSKAIGGGPSASESLTIDGDQPASSGVGDDQW